MNLPVISRLQFPGVILSLICILQPVRLNTCEISASGCILVNQHGPVFGVAVRVCLTLAGVFTGFCVQEECVAAKERVCVVWALDCLRVCVRV